MAAVERTPGHSRSFIQECGGTAGLPLAHTPTQWQNSVHSITQTARLRYWPPLFHFSRIRTSSSLLPGFCRCQASWNGQRVRNGRQEHYNLKILGTYFNQKSLTRSRSAYLCPPGPQNVLRCKNSQQSETLRSNPVGNPRKPSLLTVQDAASINVGQWRCDVQCK